MRVSYLIVKQIYAPRYCLDKNIQNILVVWVDNFVFGD